ncbi:hypothetical protein LTR70_001243 [Exophiala xenobiotica]|uniref:STB6-like N-terminal domain-containing protein n=1 Tax=Lithohypha guttulata TaxID=1690604 RepID=A0ABR0KLI5_9EURO|nr:hypothetical protein LTR24_001494 [Lithohypha guttulata]KAK5328218.1 hypothetical protein LTR70_001243 [Exophiala xenobiotica]
MAGSFPMLAALQPSYPNRSKDELYRLSTTSTSRSDDAGEDGQATEPSPLTPEGRRPSATSKTHRKLVFTDPVAFRYLEEDESTTVLARRHRLEGYELYVVEQWVVSRTHPTFTICTYTGDATHSILVNVLAVPEDQMRWSRRLRIYFDATSQSYAREKETHLGTLMVTNLSGFPSALNVISVPDGDVRKHREDFIVNENLKRMGCAGRAAMSLQYPPTSTINKFHHMYRTSEKIPLYPSVMQIVSFCQIALILYGKLESTYADGLLCDITERAVGEWWNEIGIDFHNVEPSDGILGPTTVSALIGLMIGAYNRLKEIGAPVGKDPVDLSGMKRAIAHFQKASKMERTRRLDRATLDRLHRVTANKVEDEGLTVTRALKSTVAGLGGKGGEMIARGFGGGKEKAGIAEVETLDIERLAQLVSGRSMKWLWQGKDKGTGAGTAAPSDELNGRVFSTDDQGNFIWTSGDKEGIDEFDFINSRDPEERAKRGSRIRDAVGLSSTKHHGPNAQHMDEEGSRHGHHAIPSAVKERHENPLGKRSSQNDSQEQFPALNLALADAAPSETKPGPTAGAEDTRSRAKDRSDTNQSSHRQAVRGLDHRNRESPSKRKTREELSKVREDLADERYQDFSAPINLEQPQARGLQRSRSAFQLRNVLVDRTARLPRHLSFTIVSEAIEAQHGAALSTDSGDGVDEAMQATAVLKVQKERLRQSQHLATKIFSLDRGLVPFAMTRVERVEYVESQAQAQLEELNNIYYQHLEEYQTQQATSTDLVAREKMSLNEAMRSIDMLGQKLDYELDSLGSRMQEVEESVDDFERRVLDIEANVKALVTVEEKEQQPAWYERWLAYMWAQKGVPPIEEEKKEPELEPQQELS